MKNNGRKIISIILSICMFSSVFSYASVPNVTAQASEREELEQKLEEINNKLDSLKKEKSETQEYINALDEKLVYLRNEYELTQAEAKNTTAQVEKLENSIEENTVTLANTKEEINTLQVNEQQLRTEFDSTYEDYCKRIRALYVSGNFSSTLEFILDSDGIYDFLTKLEMVASVTRRDSRLLKKVQKECEEIVATRNELKQKEQDLTKTQSILQSDTANLKVQKVNLAEKEKEMQKKSETIESQQQEANALLLKINNETQHFGEFHDMTQAEIDALDREFEEADKKYPVTTTTTTTTQKHESDNTKPNTTTTTTTKPANPGSSYINLTWPCPSHKYINCGFDDYYGHTGCDFSTGGKTGYDVVAADSGIVMISRDITCNRSTCKKSYHGGGYCSYGRYIVIRHDKLTKDGKMVYTLYAHNSQRYVSEGEHVSKGEVIAASGSTGNSTGPHLHFEVRVGGSTSSYAVDPERYLP